MKYLCFSTETEREGQINNYRTVSQFVYLRIYLRTRLPYLKLIKTEELNNKFKKCKQTHLN